jgi:DNA-binding PadR family transcriptional regulator
MRRAPHTSGSCSSATAEVDPRDKSSLRIVQEVLLALLAKEPARGYQLQARLTFALGPLAGALNAGHVYVTLTRLEKGGLVEGERIGQADGPDRKVYELTADGRARVSEWLSDTSWPKPAPAEFHLKLVAAAAAGLADPVGLIDRQRGSFWWVCERPSAPRWPSPSTRSR